MNKKSTVIGFAILVLLILAFTSLSSSEQIQDVKSYLISDIVKQEDGKFIIEEYRVCQLSRPEELGGGSTLPLKIKRHIEAPDKGVVSRDNFIKLSTELLNSLAIGLVGQMIEGITLTQALAALKCKQFFEPFTNYDYEVNLNMDSNGLQLAILETASDKKQQQTIRWSELFGKK